MFLFWDIHYYSDHDWEHDDPPPSIHGDEQCGDCAPPPCCWCTRLCGRCTRILPLRCCPHSFLKVPSSFVFLLPLCFAFVILLGMLVSLSQYVIRSPCSEPMWIARPAHHEGELGELHQEQLPYSYYYFPFCMIDTIIDSVENLIEVLRDDRIENSFYMVILYFYSTIHPCLFLLSNLSYSYYSLPLCTMGTIIDSTENLVEVLRNDHIVNSIFMVSLYLYSTIHPCLFVLSDHSETRMTRVLLELLPLRLNHTRLIF